MGFPINPRPMNPIVSGMGGSIVTLRSDVRTLHGTGPPGAVLRPLRGLPARQHGHRHGTPPARPAARGQGAHQPDLRPGPPRLDGRPLSRSTTRRRTGREIATSVEIPIAADAKAALQHAADEADGLRHSHIGTEHLLLGLLHHPESAAGAILTRAGHAAGGGARVGRVAAGGREVRRAARRPGAGHHPPGAAGGIRGRAAAQRARVGAARPRLPAVRRLPDTETSRPAGSCTRCTTVREAHATHRQSAHFLAYDAVAARAVVDKTVSKCAGRHIT